MVKAGYNIAHARKRVTLLVRMARWIWVVNSIAAVVSIMRTRYDIAALAAFTWILSLVATAVGHRAQKYLGTVEHKIVHSSDAICCLTNALSD